MRLPRPYLLPVQPTSRAVLLASGVSAQMLRTALEGGRLYRVRQGVFLDAALWPEDPRERHLLRAVAELIKFPAGVLSHESAAASWKLPSPGFTRWEECPVAITLPRGGRMRSRTGTANHHVGLLPESQVTKDAGGRPITSIARTAVDLAAGRTLPDALVILDGAARLLCAAMVAEPRRRDYANPRLIAAAREMLEQAAATRRPGGLGRAMELADPRRESAPESLSAGHFHLAGLPEPQLQRELRSPMGKLYPDFYWPEHRLIGECDGAEKYREDSAYVREKEREQALRDLGYRMVRWLAKEIMLDPKAVVERVARELA
ncbi:MAG: DUF559 domain-containing protein [Micropruina sp.]|uniref:DUF559 domain-containing protein n=1 Tax=Micropruina sp. TaxID=2737536 RepID=UPI0039E36EBA